MTTTPTSTRPKNLYRFLALKRADVKARYCCRTVAADSEQAARRELARDYILSLAVRLPSPEVQHG